MPQLEFLAETAQQQDAEVHKNDIEFDHERTNITWEVEKKILEQRNEDLKSELEELKRKRLEDLKANERLLSIFAAKEEAWKAEKRKLEQELQNALKEANRTSFTEIDQSEEHNYAAVVAELKDKKRKVEIMLRNAMVEMAAWKRNAALKAKEKMNLNVLLRNVTEEVLNLQKEVNDRDDIISALSKRDDTPKEDTRLRDSLEAELKATELQLSNAKSLLKHYVDIEQRREGDAVKWKRLYLAIKAEFEILQRQYRQSYALNENAGGGEINMDVSSSSRRIKVELEKKHSEEIRCLEREIKAKNEQMKAQGMQLISMEKGALENEREMDNLRQDLCIARKDKVKAKNKITSMQQMLSTPHTTSNSSNHTHEIYTNTRQDIVQVKNIDVRPRKLRKDQNASHTLH